MQTEVLRQLISRWKKDAEKVRLNEPHRGCDKDSFERYGHECGYKKGKERCADDLEQLINLLEH
jgi:hypothetical protein